jgi:hypothetical protein
VIQTDRIMSDYSRASGRGFRTAPACGWVTVAAAVVWVGGCAMRITPPGGLGEPTQVFIADYGYHASLLLPRDDGYVSEFAYGQWDWFALNRDRWYNAVVLVLLPGRGTLGTRTLAGPAARETLARQCRAERLLELHVERERARSLLARLEREYESGRSTELFNSLYGMMFVHQPRTYWLHRNCNTVLADWLEELGCHVEGTRLFAAFVLRGGVGRSGRRAQRGPRGGTMSRTGQKPREQSSSSL